MTKADAHGVPLSDTRVIKARTEFVIAGYRITVSWLHSDRWDNGERARRLGLPVGGGRAQRQAVRADWRPIAVVSLHALARRVERGSDRSHAALTLDLAALLDAGATRAVTVRVATASATYKYCSIGASPTVT